MYGRGRREGTPHRTEKRVKVYNERVFEELRSASVANCVGSDEDDGGADTYVTPSAN